jgi:hypothetical protein
MSPGKFIASMILCASVLAGLIALAINVLTYVSPERIDPLVSTWRATFSKVAYIWGVILAVGAVITLRVMNPTSGESVRFRGVGTLLALCWLFAIVTVTFLSSTESLRFKDGHWELGGRFQSWRPISETEARVAMRLQVRTSSAIVVGEAATVLCAAVLLLGRSTAR